MKQARQHLSLARLYSESNKVIIVCKRNIIFPPLSDQPGGEELGRRKHSEEGIFLRAEAKSRLHVLLSFLMELQISLFPAEKRWVSIIKDWYISIKNFPFLHPHDLDS
jgi:hypothetical protein